MDQHPNRPVRVLVIEDNPADIELLRLALDTAKFTYSMTVVNDGGDALALFKQTNGDIPDVAILDLNLPKYDGLEILEAARANPGLAAMPIVILTSSSSPRERSRIQMFRLVTYIRKPPELDQYLSIGPVIRDLVQEALK